jgi:Tfp pilus assembly pilus retraction ATPase PilT
MGMRLMNDSLFQLVKDGLVTPEEALSKATEKSQLQSMFKQANVAFKEVT